MKKITVLICVLLSFSSCEKPSDCVESAGNSVSKTVEVTPFTRIEVNRGIELIIMQGPQYNVEIKTGENLINTIEVKQIDNVLSLKDNSSCNWVREYGITKVYITAPNLEEIYSKTERNISSDGVLTYPTLRLYALDKDGDGRDGAGTNDFYLNINNNQLVIENNNVARYFISGTTNEAIFNLYAGDGRIDASNLTTQSLKVFHRGSNDMIVRPIQSITGKMLSTGNIILKNNPPLVDVQQMYQGHIIYY